jgi:transcriptional regulator with XRE-family HTH domain
LSPQRLSSVIRKLREARGLTQAEVAERADVKKQYVTMLERGARKNPSLPVLKRIAKALGVPVTELLE